MNTVFERRATSVLWNLFSSDFAAGGVCLIPANVCPVVPLMLIAARRSFEFIDINPETLCLDWDLVKSRMTASERSPVTGIIYVRTYGYMEDASEFFRALKASWPELDIIDDRCQCRPEPDPLQVDCQGADAVLYSTGYAKYVDLGFGGFAHLYGDINFSRYSRDFQKEHLTAITEFYKQHIREENPMYCGGSDGWRWLDKNHPLLDYSHWIDVAPPEIGWNDYMQRTIERREDADKRKAVSNAVYKNIIPSEVQLVDGFHDWRFQIHLYGKDELIEKIFDSGLFASSHYFPASTLFGNVLCSRSIALHRGIVNLFNDFHITEYQVQRVAEVVRDHLLRNIAGPAGSSARDTPSE